MPEEIIRFEDFELDPGSFELRRAGQPLKLERIPLQLLFLLARNRDRFVSREEILHTIWGKDVFIDADNSINTAVRKARQALKDDPESPRYLRTVPGKGYRFTGQVSPVVSPVTSRPLRSENTPEAQPIPSALPTRKTSLRRAFLTSVALLALLASGLAIRSSLKRPAKVISGKAMLVVLPFLNLSGDPHEDYFADGMTEEMITQLGGLDPQRLGVIARTSSMQYKGAQKGAAQVARELGVDYLLEGSIRRDQQRVRVTAQLIQASDQTHLWAADFDRDPTDVLRLQSDIALAISGKIQLTLSAATRERLKDAPRVDPAAHESYLQGRYSFELRTRPAVEKAIADFQRTITLDPNYAPAQAALARAYSLAPVVGAMPSAESLPKAREAALQSISLDPSLAPGHSTLGFVLAHYDFDWPGAQSEYLKALELNPNDAYAHLFYSNSYLSPLGRHAEAIEEMRKAISLDPYSAPVQSFLGRTYVWSRQYDVAMAQFEKCAEMFPGFAVNHERMAKLFAFRGQFEDAIAEDAQARLLSGETESAVSQQEAALRHAWSTGGSRGYWQENLELSRLPDNPPEGYDSSFSQAVLYVHLGEKGKALACLETAIAQHSMSMTEIAIEPAFDPIRGEPRFQELLRRVGLNKAMAHQ